MNGPAGIPRAGIVRTMPYNSARNPRPDEEMEGTMTALPTALYTAEQVRELDRRAIEEAGIPGIVLMKRAGRAALKALLDRWPEPVKITVYCGGGNNGGDGYIVAGLARERGIDAEIVQVAPAEKLKGDAERAWRYAREAGVAMTPFEEAPVPEAGVIVDAMLGTGIKGALRKPFDEAVAAVNSAGLPVMAVDIPSGLDSDTGVHGGSAVRAQVTPTFIGLKRGLFTGKGPAVVGEVVFDDLGTPDSIRPADEAATEILDLSSLRSLLGPRPRDAHKGHYGHVMVIGGDQGFGGAVAMAAEAALRTGAGLVSAATRAEHVAAILARCPEVMALATASGQELEPHLDRPSVLVVGPGLGRSPWSEQLFQKAVASGLPLIIDADGLNILAQGRIGAGADAGKWLLTPHPGEAARLLGCEPADIQADRFAAVRALQQKYGATVILKGAGSLVCGGGDEPVGLCTGGNPGMATGGMGDVLSGILGGLLAQGLSPGDAARLGVCLHARAADRAAGAGGERGLGATDLFQWLRREVNGL